MLGDGVAIFLGIVAGALVQLGLNIVTALYTGRQAKIEAAFELDYILHTKMPAWRTALANCRRLVAEGRGAESHEYVDLTAVSMRALSELVQTRKAYRLFGGENLAKLLEVNAFLLPPSENYFNERLRVIRGNTDRPTALRDFDFIDWKFNDVAQKAAAVRAKLPGKSVAVIKTAAS